jgi:hypothetical protein
MRIQPEYMSFKNRCTISSSYEFQAHQQRSQRRCCFSQNALLWFEVLPDAHRFVAGAPRCSAMQRDPSPGRQAACNYPSEGTRFRQSRQSRPEHPGVSDGNRGCCWCTLVHLFWMWMVVSVVNASIIFVSYCIQMLSSNDINTWIHVTSPGRYDCVWDILLNVNTRIRGKYNDHSSIKLFEYAVK